jgi:hypothetical protein
VGARLALLLFVATALPGITLAAQPGEAGRPVAAGRVLIAISALRRLQSDQRGAG